MNDNPDQELAMRAAAGDRPAFAELAARHYDRIHALAWRVAGSRTAAEDIAQEAMVKIARAIAGFRGESAFSTWAWRIAYNTAIDYLREQQKIVVFPPARMAELMDAPDAGNPEEDAMNGDLWRAVRGLPDLQRDAVLLVYAEDLSHAEAAVIMGCAEKTISWHLHEARKRLKSHLEGRAGVSGIH